MKSIKAILWDMDGVLVDSERLYKSIFVDLMNEAGFIDNPADIYMQSIGLNKKAIIELYLQFMSSEKEAEFYYSRVGEIYFERMHQDLKLKPGVEQSLETVKSLSLPQMVVTSTQTKNAIRKLDSFSLMHYFEDLIGGDQVEKGKPNPEPYLKACDTLNIHPENALVIEDSPNGVKAGLAAGCSVLHVPDLVTIENEWQDLVHHSMDSLDDFPDWIVSKT